MTVQTYAVGEYPPEGKLDLLENKLQVSFVLMGFPGMEIDPRAGRLEFAYQSRTMQVGPSAVKLSEFKALEKCDYELLDQKLNFVYSHELLVERSYCLPADAYVEGYLSSSGSSFPMIRIAKCKASILPEG